MEVQLKIKIPKKRHFEGVIDTDYEADRFGNYFAEKLMLIVADMATRSLETVNQLHTFADEYDVYYEAIPPTTKKEGTIILHVKLPDYIHAGSTFIDVLKFYEKVFQRILYKEYNGNYYRGGKK